MIFWALLVLWVSHKFPSIQNFVYSLYIKQYEINAHLYWTDEVRLPHIRKKDREYFGMFEYKFEDENIIIRRLVTGKNILMKFFMYGY